MRILKHSLTVLSVFIVLSALVFTGCGKKEPVSTKAATDSKTVAAVQEEAVPSMKPITEERTFYGFENDLQGWEIPMWAANKSDYVAKGVVISKDVASEGSASLKMMANFPGNIWTAALAEIEQYLDISRFRVIRADIFLPKDAPIGLKAKIIVTVGENWKFVEMNQDTLLMPGEWVTLSANVEPGSYDWKRIVPDKEFAADVRKISIRIVSNRKPKYSGPLYIDNVRVGK